MNAPRITLEDIEANIADEFYFTAAEGVKGSEPSLDTQYEPLRSLGLLTFCVLVLQNGYTVVGESACVSPENYDKDIGQTIARKKAVENIWPLMGYGLQQELFTNA